MEPPPPVAGKVCFGVFEADLAAGELRKRARKVPLQEQPFQVLVLLLHHAGEVVTREELQHALWPSDTFVEFEQGVNTAIKKLRQALGDSADNPRFIETLPRKGYPRGLHRDRSRLERNEGRPPARSSPSMVG